MNDEYGETEIVLESELKATDVIASKEALDAMHKRLEYLEQQHYAHLLWWARQRHYCICDVSVTDCPVHIKNSV